MGLIERLTEAPPKRPPVKSVMDVWLESRPEAEQKIILDAAMNREWGHVALLKELVAEGAPELSDNSFRAWRVKRGLV
jgi:hypothetical protein